MDTDFQLVTSKQFNGIILDCYQKKGQIDPTIFYVTREQIGLALGYEYPNDSILHIHVHNEQRLDRFSSWGKLTSVEGDRTVVRECIVYSFKGLLEICRYSQQPNVNAVIDVLWEIADELRRNGSYIIQKKDEDTNHIIIQPSIQDIMKAADHIYSKAFSCKNYDDFYAVLAIDKVFKEFTGKSALDIAGLQLIEATRSASKDIHMSSGRIEHISCDEPYLAWKHHFQNSLCNSEE